MQKRVVQSRTRALAGGTALQANACPTSNTPVSRGVGTPGLASPRGPEKGNHPERSLFATSSWAGVAQRERIQTQTKSPTGQRVTVPGLGCSECKICGTGAMRDLHTRAQE